MQGERPGHVRRNRNEHIPVGIRNLLVQTDPYEFETIGPVAQEQGAAISDSAGSIDFVVKRRAQKL